MCVVCAWGRFLERQSGTRVSAVPATEACRDRAELNAYYAEGNGLFLSIYRVTHHFFLSLVESVCLVFFAVLWASRGGCLVDTYLVEFFGGTCPPRSACCCTPLDLLTACGAGVGFGTAHSLPCLVPTVPLTSTVEPRFIRPSPLVELVTFFFSQSPVKYRRESPGQ